MAGLPPSTDGRPFTPSRIGRFFFPSRSLTCGAPTANLSQQSKPAAFSPDNADVAWVKRVTLDGRAIPSRIGAPAWAPSAYDPTRPRSRTADPRMPRTLRGSRECGQGLPVTPPVQPSPHRLPDPPRGHLLLRDRALSLGLGVELLHLRDLLVEDVGCLRRSIKSLAAHVVLVLYTAIASSTSSTTHTFCASRHRTRTLAACRRWPPSTAA